MGVGGDGQEVAAILVPEVAIYLLTYIVFPLLFPFLVYSLK